MAFRDSYEQHEKEAIHEKLAQSDTVSDRDNLSALLTTPVLNQSDLFDPGQRLYQIHGQLAGPLISHKYIPAETSSLLPIDILEQGAVPILLSISQMRNLYMTIEHTPQGDKVTCKAFGVDRQAVARVKSHGEIAVKRDTNYVYDDDNSIKFPSWEPSKSDTVCAAKSSETKEDTATPKIIGSLKQDHWILDKKNEQLIRAHMTPRKALFTHNGPK